MCVIDFLFDVARKYLISPLFLWGVSRLTLFNYIVKKIVDVVEESHVFTQALQCIIIIPIGLIIISVRNNKNRAPEKSN